MRERNRSLVLNLVRIRQPISRVALTRLTGLTKGTVSNITSTLIREELLQEISIGQSTGGRPPTLLKLASERNLLGAVDVRPRLTTLAVATLDGTILRRAVIETQVEAPVAFLTTCARQVKEMLRQFGDKHVIGVGMTVPGTVSHDRRRIVASVDLGWREVSIEPVARLLPWPLVLENDANAAALAELYFGEAGLEEDVVSLVLSDNLGGGIIEGGRLFRGGNGQAGEFGHMVVDPSGEPCRCGRQGCLGAYASGHGTVSRYRIAHLRQAHREDPAQPVAALTAEPVARAIRLQWEDATAVPRQYEVYRSRRLPVPQDAAHLLATTVRAMLLDQPPEGGRYHYTVVAVDLNGRRSAPCAPASAAPGPPHILVDDVFPGAALDAYRVAASVPPVATAEGLQVGDGADDHHCTLLWRDDLEAVEVTGVVEPEASGVYDTCGVLVKVQDAAHWYCALLAYGDQLASGHTLSVMRQTGGGDEWLAFYPFSVTLGARYVIRVRASEAWVRVKAWPEGTPEPEGWQLSIKDDTGWRSGGVGFRAYGRRARLRALHAERSALAAHSLGASPGHLLDHTGPVLQLILEQARQGDETACAVLAETGRYLGIGISNIYTAFGIRRFRFSGRMVEGWDQIAPVLRETLRRQQCGDATLDVQPSVLGHEASVMGAVSVASLPLFEEGP